MNEGAQFVLPFWAYWGLIFAVPIVFLILLHLRADPSRESPIPKPPVPPAVGPGIGNRFIRMVDWISTYSGRFISFWIVITVAYYSFEVFLRYAYNSPTNWAHEASFLMFGMMFILCGAYGYLFRAHVRVDAIYVHLPRQWQLVVEIVTWLLFLVYMLAFIQTSWTFFVQSADQKMFFWAQGFDNETSFSEWRVSYVPVKGMMVVGSVMLLLQGIANLIRDVREFRNCEENNQ